MKINIEFDLTPEEFRQAMGLPDVESFQQELMNTILEKMKNGEADYDAFNLFQPFITNSMELMQNNFMNFMGQKKHESQKDS